MNTPLIYQNSDTLSGTPIFYGTRVPLQHLIDYLTTGETLDDFLDNFPSVQRDQAIEFLQSAQKINHANG